MYSSVSSNYIIYCVPCIVVHSKKRLDLYEADQENYPKILFLLFKNEYSLELFLMFLWIYTSIQYYYLLFIYEVISQTIILNFSLLNAEKKILAMHYIEYWKYTKL